MTVRADLPSKEIANLLIPRISVSVTGASGWMKFSVFLNIAVRYGVRFCLVNFTERFASLTSLYVVRLSCSASGCMKTNSSGSASKGSSSSSAGAVAIGYYSPFRKNYLHAHTRPINACVGLWLGLSETSSNRWCSQTSCAVIAGRLWVCRSVGLDLGSWTTAFGVYSDGEVHSAEPATWRRSWNRTFLRPCSYEWTLSRHIISSEWKKLTLVCSKPPNAAGLVWWWLVFFMSRGRLRWSRARAPLSCISVVARTSSSQLAELSFR